MKERCLSLIVSLFVVLNLISCSAIKINWDSNSNKQIASNIYLGILGTDIANEDIDIQKEALFYVSKFQKILATIELDGVGAKLDITEIMELVEDEIKTDIDPRIILICQNIIEGNLGNFQVEAGEDDVEVGEDAIEALKNVRIIIDLVVEKLTGNVEEK
jgi:hypothetical protein